ncbi:hypothetical protein CPC08DRAFT_746400 [Agrocybe pediades]|nr:hypothetical protein CPC08DRAFT_746400 [Agrocybe pediades]
MQIHHGSRRYIPLLGVPGSKLNTVIFIMIGIRYVRLTIDYQRSAQDRLCEAPPSSPSPSAKPEYDLLRSAQVKMADNTRTGRGEDASHPKKKRNQGACDVCKRKKVRCDSGIKPGNRCTNCIQYGYDCTHKEVSKALGPAKGYVESLEARLEKMDKLIGKLMPDIDVDEELDKLDHQDEPNILPRNDDEDPCSTVLLRQLKKLSLNPSENRFFGKSRRVIISPVGGHELTYFGLPSGYQLVQTALDLRQEYDGFKWTPRPFKREEFWEIPPWVEVQPEIDEHPPSYTYPAEDLMRTLIDNYFHQVNIFWPLLHRPTFERQITASLHLRDGMFGAVLLLVCAHGARFSDDPRTFAEGSTNPRSAGWQWFQQVSPVRKSLYNKTTLLELQMHALHITWAQSSEMPQGIWAQVGLATRFAQEVGAHRRRRKEGTPPTAEDELWKRAFWVLLCIDRNLGAYSGRPCALQDEDLDVDRPVACDDEYWERGFKQPDGKPSYIAFFDAYIGLMDILAHAMRMIYPIKHPNRQFFQSRMRSDQQIIAELDSAMNKWMDAVPSHLKWNPKCENECFMKQSSALHATYYHLQIFIHRPFIPSPRNPKPVSFPSLAICTNAARSCCHVLEAFTKMAALPLAEFHILAFVSAIVLLLNIWSGKRSGYAPHPKREMEYVQRCMDILERAEKRFAKAGRYRDILREVAYAGDVPLSTVDCPEFPANTRKRTRDSETANEAEAASFEPGWQRNIATNRRVADIQASSQHITLADATPSSASSSSPISSLQTPSYTGDELATFSLPMYGDELGRLPVYGQISFSDSLVSHLPASFPGSDGGQEHFAPDNLVWGTHPDVPNTFISAPTSINNFNNHHSNGNALASTSISAQRASGFVNAGAPKTMNVNCTPDPFATSRFNNDATTSNESSDTYFDLNAFLIACGAGPSAPLSNTSASTNANVTSSVPNPDDDTIAMWSMAPTNFGLDDWSSYIQNAEQMARPQEPQEKPFHFDF